MGKGWRRDINMLCPSRGKGGYPLRWARRPRLYGVEMRERVYRDIQPSIAK